MDQTTTTALTQLGLSAIFAIACVQLFSRLEKINDMFRTYLMETITTNRQMINLLIEQNKQLSVALFANNPDAQRAYAAMAKQQNRVSPNGSVPIPEPTDLGAI